MWRGERERRRMTAAMAGAAVYIAMVGGRGTDGWHRRRRHGNRVSSMWTTDGRMNDRHVV